MMRDLSNAGSSTKTRDLSEKRKDRTGEPLPSSTNWHSSSLDTKSQARSNKTNESKRAHTKQRSRRDTCKYLEQQK